MIRLFLKKPRYILPYWVASKAAAAMTDLAEFLGTVIALYLLFGVPLIYGTFLSRIGCAVDNRDLAGEGKET